MVTNQLPPIIPETTKIFTEETLQHLAVVSPDGSFVFSQVTPELVDLKPGDVIVGGVSSNTPEGFLRRVTGLSDDHLVISTTFAALEDAICQGEIHTSKELGEFYGEWEDFVIMDFDGAPGTTGDQIRADGSLSLKPSFDLDLVIQECQVRSLSFVTRMEKTVQLDITSYLKVYNLDREYELPLDIPTPTFIVTIGSVPIVIKPEVTPVIGLDGEVHVGLTMGASQQTVSAFGGKYENGNWETISEFEESPAVTNLALTAGLEVKGYVGTRLTLRINGVTGPYLRPDLYLELDADIFANPWWSLYGGIEVLLGVQVDIFGYTLTDWEGPAVGYRVLLAQASGPRAGVTTRVSVASGGGQGNSFSWSPSLSADGRYVAFISDASNLISDDTNGLYDVFVHDRLTGQTSRVSIATDGMEGNNHAGHPSISGDGRYVTFISDASNLVSGDTNDDTDIFIHDRQTGQTTRVSVASDGTQGNDSSRLPSISANGRYVTFTSDASNLVSGDTNGLTDIFVHDQLTGETTLISITSTGAQGNAASYASSISADGRYVVFTSQASNLIPVDANDFIEDIFVHDRQTGQTALISMASDGTQGNDPSWESSISGDGRYVAFQSVASNLIDQDINGVADIFVHDRETGETNLVSLALDGTQANHYSQAPSISDDGRYTAFYSEADNLVSGDTNGYPDIFIHDQQTGETVLVSIASDGTQSLFCSYRPTISGDGRFAAFDTVGLLVPGDTNLTYDVFVHYRGE